MQQPPAIPPGYAQYGGYVPHVPPGPAAGLMYASFWRRLGGYILDALLVAIPTAAILVPFVLGPYINAVTVQVRSELQPSYGSDGTIVIQPIQTIAMRDVVPSTTLLVAFVLVAMIAATYYTTMVAATGSTLGQKAVGVSVIRTEDGGRLGFGRSALRAIPFWIATPAQALPGIGALVGVLVFISLLWVAWDPRKQGLHDKLARSYVVYPLPVMAGYGYAPPPGYPTTLPPPPTAPPPLQ